MSISYNVEFDKEQLAEVTALFEFIGGNAQDAQRVAINKAGPKIRTLASSQIRKQIRLKAGFVNKRLKFKKATRGNLSARIEAPSRGRLLSRFSTDSRIAGEKVSWIKPPPIPARGIRVKVKPGSSPKVVSGGGPGTTGKPFYMVIQGGRLAIAARKSSPGPQGGKIDVLHGPSLSQVFTDVKEDVTPDAEAEYTKQMADAMRFLLAKRNPSA